MEGEKEPKELILASILQTNRLSNLVSADLKPPDRLPGEEHQDSSAPATRKADTQKTLHITIPAEPLVRITQTLNDQLTQLLVSIPVLMVFSPVRNVRLPASGFINKIKLLVVRLFLVQDISTSFGVVIKYLIKRM
jgi:hypothetical protein